MADHIFTFKLEKPAIIAVMGLPYTFREEMGNYIAKWAKCPNSKFEVILNALLDANDPGIAALHSPSDVAFHILCQTALSLLDKDDDPSNCAVINFPTPTNPQLQRLLFSVLPYRFRLLIIECQRRNQFRWRQAVENPNAGLTYNLRYDTGNTETGKWEDVEKAILNHQQQRLDAYFLTLLAEYPHVDMKKLVVDPFEDLKARDFTENQGLDRSSLFAQAIKSYLDHDVNYQYCYLPVNLDYAAWRRQRLEHQASFSRIRRKGISSEHSWCRPGDCILRFTNIAKKGEPGYFFQLVSDCDACDRSLTMGEGAYYCQFCILCLHELCALAQSPTVLTAKTTNTHSEVVFNYARSPASTTFKESIHACYYCNKDGKPFSQDCDACLFQTHLKCQLLPTVVKHNSDQPHFFSIRLSWTSIDNTVYDCEACGLMGAYSSYSCNICNSEYHLPCVLDMPLQTNLIPHGGHTHTLNLNFSCGQREHEYEWCPVCYADINPDTWVYTCQHCDFVAHLYCIFPSDLFEWYKDITRDDSYSVERIMLLDFHREMLGLRP